MRLDYGKKGLEFQPDKEWNVTILTPKQQSILKNPIKEIKKAIQNPIGSKSLEKIITSKGKIKDICIVTSDSTRPVPSNIILKALIERLLELGIKYSQIQVLIATGLHRSSKEDEIERIIGTNIVDKINSIDHNAENENQMKYIVDPKTKRKIGLNKQYIDADLKVLTGYVEPHFFFGFSGGRKSIIPGIASKNTILNNHSAKNISSTKSRFGIYESNPMHKEANQIANLVGVDFMVNVCINKKHQITKVLAGNSNKVHEKLVQYQKTRVFHRFNKKFDIVICGNGGYPLDLNLYQAVKSMAIGEMIVKDGGTIISVNELSEGVGIGQDDFKNLIFSGEKPEIIHSKILSGQINLPDQWEIQVLTRILKKCKVIVVSKMREKELGNIGLKHAPDINTAVKECLEKYGRNASILILPHGPQILPIYNH